MCHSFPSHSKLFRVELNLTVITGFQKKRVWWIASFCGKQKFLHRKRFSVIAIWWKPEDGG